MPWNLWWECPVHTWAAHNIPIFLKKGWLRFSRLFESASKKIQVRLVDEWETRILHKTPDMTETKCSYVMLWSTYVPILCMCCVNAIFVTSSVSLADTLTARFRMGMDGAGSASVQNRSGDRNASAQVQTWNFNNIWHTLYFLKVSLFYWSQLDVNVEALPYYGYRQVNTLSLLDLLSAADFFQLTPKFPLKNRDSFFQKLFFFKKTTLGQLTSTGSLVSRSAVFTRQTGVAGRALAFFDGQRPTFLCVEIHGDLEQYISEAEKSDNNFCCGFYCSQLLLYRTGVGTKISSPVWKEIRDIRIPDCTKHTGSCFCGAEILSVRYVRIPVQQSPI